MPDQIDLSAMQSVPKTSEYGFLRLHRYWRAPDEDMWDEIWSSTKSLDYWKSALAGNLFGYEKIFLKYLEGGRLLEAGCGVGQVVLALRARGYDCHGIDYAKSTIELLNTEFPDVPFYYGDIRSIPYDNAFFDGYISLGVIEHFVNGQQEMINEAARVLKTGGYIFISVPALNRFRKFRIRLGSYQTKSDMPFFESCISKEEMLFLLKNAGLDFIDVIMTNPVMTFVQETRLRPLYRHIEDVRYVRGAVDRLLSMILPRSWFGHMMMIVARKR